MSTNSENYGSKGYFIMGLIIFLILFVLLVLYVYNYNFTLQFN
jgi:hypothetical protein